MENKIIASILTAIMTLATLAFPVLAVDLGDYPSFLFEDGNLDAFVVVGADAAPADVVGGIDLAVRLAASSVVSKALPGVKVAVTGLDRDGISIGTASGGAALTTGGSVYSNPFPSGQVKTSHFAGLKDSTFSWKSNDYDYREQVDVSAVRMRHDFGTTNINGTEKMEIESGDVFYEYVFEKALNLSTATSAGTTGTCFSGSGTCEYTNPVKIKLLGWEFTIVGVGTTGVKALVGSSGTATKEGATRTGVTYGEYTVYVTSGANNDWASFQIEKGGSVVDSVSGITEGNSKDSSAAGLTVKVTDVRVSGTDPSTQHIEVDIVVGPTGQVEKDYDTSADVESTGTANDRFPGETRWGIQTSGFSTSGYIPANAKIQVIYKPSSTVYLVAGEKLSLPNSYGELGFSGWGTDKFATITVKPVTGLSGYNYSADTQSFGNLNGFEISTDVSSSIVSLGANTYNKAYVLFNRSLGTSPLGNNWPVFIGFYDNAKQKVLINGTATNVNTDYVSAVNEYESVNLNGTVGSFRYDFKLSYGGAGERDFYLNVTVQPNTTTLIKSMVAGPAGSAFVNMTEFQNKTTWSTSQAPEFRLGPGSSSETNDLQVRTEGSSHRIGRSTQDVVDDSGLIVLAPESNANSDRVVFKVPNKELTVRAYFGSPSGVTVGGGTYNEPLPIKTAVAKLDTEISNPATVGKHLVLVGGPAVNRHTASAMGLSYPTYGASGLLPYGSGEGYISLHDGVFSAGQWVVTVQGWEAGDTRNAASVLQQWDDFASQLDGQMAVKVTSVSAGGITPA